MNDFSIKQSTIVDAPASKLNPRDKADRAAALAALASSFRDLVHRFGSNLDTGLNSIAEQRGITAVSETRKPSQNSNDQRADRDDRADDHQVAQRDDHPRARGRDDSHRDDHGEARRHAPEAANRDERSDNRPATDGAPKDESAAGNTESAERPADNTNNGDKHGAANDGQKSDHAGADKAADGTQNTAETKAGPATQSTQKTDVSATLAGIVAPTTGLEKAETVATQNARGLTADGPANDTAKQNAAAGLAAATANTKDGGVHASENGRQQSNNAAAAKQAAGNGQNQNQADTATRGQTGVQQQAQQMARALGDDTRMQINVDVADDAETLTSRPMTTLAAGSAVGDQGKGQNQGTQQNSHAATPGQAQAAVSANAQAQNGQAQGQNQQSSAQANQAQGIQQVGTDAKGPVTASTTNHNAGSASTAGGESASSTSSTTGTGQTQQTQQTQHTARAEQAAQARGQYNGPSPAEQVSVRITRALEAGNDRISIRLNPAELGRVDVKVELSHDGRMTAVVTADKPETLDMLRRDASELQKALQQGGIDLSTGDMAFNLRGEQGQTADGGDGNAGTSAAKEETETVDTNPELVLQPGDIVLGEGRVDVRA